MRIALLILLLLLAAGAFWLWTPDKPRAALEARYAAAPSRFTDVLGVRVHWRDTGPREAPVVVFLHGFGSSLHTWEEVAAGLAPEFRAVRMDLPGFGLSAPDPGRDYSDARSIAVILEVLRQAGVEGAFDLVGSSMGGRIAFRLAAEHPDRVRRLVLMAPDGFRSPGREYGQRPKAPWWVWLIPHVMPDAALRPLLRATYAEPERALTPELFARYRDLLRAPGVRQAILDRAKDSVLTPPEPVLRAIRAPTLLLWGEADRLVPVSAAALFAAELPDSRTVVLPRVGHVPMEEDVPGTVAALRAFLAP